MKRTLFLLLVGCSTLLRAADRIALVIGNNSYPHLSESSQLQSPRNDAADLASVLTEIGFTVLNPVLDGTRTATIEAKEDFFDQSKNAQIAVLFYSGHGVQVGEHLYLMPTDTPRLKTPDTLKDHAINLQDVMESLERTGAKTKIIILDCCRDNPFELQLVRLLAQGSKSLTVKSIGEDFRFRGAGFFLAFATSPGQTAADGNGARNSPFTLAFVNNLRKNPMMGVRELLDEVKHTVRESSGESQVPWVNDSLDKTHEKVLARRKPTPANPPALPALEAFDLASDPLFGGLANRRNTPVNFESTLTMHQVGGPGPLAPIVEVEVEPQRRPESTENNAESNQGDVPKPSVQMTQPAPIANPPPAIGAPPIPASENTSGTSAPMVNDQLPAAPNPADSGGSSGRAIVTINNNPPGPIPAPPVIYTIDNIFDGTRYAGFNLKSRKLIIAKVQQKLRIAADGKSGRETCAAIREWQAGQTLEPTGALTWKTLESLDLQNEINEPEPEPRKTPISKSRPDVPSRPAPTKNVPPQTKTDSKPITKPESKPTKRIEKLTPANRPF